MLVSPPVRKRHRGPVVTPTRVVATLGALLLLALIGPLVAHDPLAGAYLLLVLATMYQLRGVRAEPGSWLGRRAVRRGLVALMGVLCVALLATPAPTSAAVSGNLFVLFLVLVLLNIGLGRATQRVATAEDSSVDERQEALRNRAHRIAYAILAGLGGVLLLCDVASTQSRSWLVGSLGGGGLIAVAELLFVLPAMVLAFLEPSRIPAEGATVHSTHDRVAAWLLAVTLALPLVLSIVVVVLPEHLTASVAVPSDPGAGTPPANCREFFATRSVGLLVSAQVPLHAEVCWDGHRAVESFGMNSSDCLIADASFTSSIATTCARTTSADGTLSFTYAAQVTPMMLPFLHREVTLRVVIDRNGNVEQFP